MNGRSRARDLFERFVNEGEAVIDEFIAAAVSEELFIDYKRSANDGASRFEQSDRENFARAISGFGNSAGGVIVWGVDCRNDPVRGDVPTSKHPLENPKRFVSYLEGASSGCTLPPHDGVRHHAIQRGAGDGFVVTLVPKSMYAPHQCIVGKHKDKYHIRVGSNFVLAPHDLLAGMFGQQPNPSIYAMWGVGGAMSPATWAPVINSLPTSTPYVWWKFIIRNDGLVAARDLYLNVSIGQPGPNVILVTDKFEARWEMHGSFGGWHLISAEGFRLAPGSIVEPFSVKMFLSPPFVDPLRFEITLGCDGSRVQRISHTVSAEKIRAAHADFVASSQDSHAGAALASDVFDLEQVRTNYEKSLL